MFCSGHKNRDFAGSDTSLISWNAPPDDPAPSGSPAASAPPVPPRHNSAMAGTAPSIQRANKPAHARGRPILPLPTLSHGESGVTVRATAPAAAFPNAPTSPTKISSTAPHRNTMNELNGVFKSHPNADFVITEFQIGLYRTHGTHGTAPYLPPVLSVPSSTGSRVFAANEGHVFVLKSFRADKKHPSPWLALLRYPTKSMALRYSPTDTHQRIECEPVVPLPTNNEALSVLRRESATDLFQFGDNLAFQDARVERRGGFSLVFAPRQPAGLPDEEWECQKRFMGHFNHSKDCMTSLDAGRFPNHELIGETTFVRFEPSGQPVRVKGVENLRGDVAAYPLADKQWMVTPKGAEGISGLLPEYTISFLLCAMAVSARGKDADAVEDHLDRWTGTREDGSMWASAFDNEAVIRAMDTADQHVHRLDMSQDDTYTALEKLRGHIAKHGPAIIIRDEAMLGQKASRLCHVVDAVEPGRLTIREPITGEQHVIRNHKEFWLNDFASSTVTPIKAVPQNWIEKKLRKLAHSAQDPNPFAGITAVFIPAGAIPAHAPR